ncbi:MAG: CpaF family protein [Candidatus Micrarchaeota archaeon]|nr:CpaF family protein [Candidatus Micrarchaeota archaeon]
MKRLQLGLDIDFEGGYEAVENLGGLVPKAIVKDGQAYRYLVAAGLRNITGLEKGYAEAAKSAVVDALANTEDEIGIGLLDTARKIAKGSLSAHMSDERADFISYMVAHDTVGYGPISMLMEDRKRIEEIEVNAPAAPLAVFHADYGRCATNLRFVNEGAFRHSLNKLIYETDKELDEDTPIIDAQVGDARIHAQIAPYAQSGAVASIRLTDNRLVGFDYLLRRGTVGFDALAYLWLAMDSGLNVIVAGAPASGKTTMMSALFGFVSRVEKVLIVEEEVNELKIRLDVNNSVALYGSGIGGKTNTRNQVTNALRMRPDRLVIGEVRGDETRELFAGANLGVPFMTTMHSNEGGMEIIKKLMVKPMNVDVRSLNCLDLALYMKHIGISKRVLGGLYEYKWLSRAETDRLGTVIEESDSVDMVSMVNEGVLDSGVMRSSKVIDAYSRKSGKSQKMALREMERRAEFLKVVFEGCKSPREMLDKIQGYECA